MNKLLLTREDKKKILSISDLTEMVNQECYVVNFKDIDGSIWCSSINEIYELIHKSTEELQIICDNQ